MNNILLDLEKGTGPTRNAQWYFFSIFGSPAKDTKWGWRVEGHHLSLNFTVDHGQMVSATPFFFGANPATVKGGPRNGLRTLPEAEDTAQELFASFDAEQKKVAFQAKQFPEIEQARSAPNVGPPVGLPAARLTDKQKGLLQQLIDGYAGRMPPDIAAVELNAIKEAGLDKVTFAFARDDDKPGKPYTYRVQGPTFVIEFLNIQEDAGEEPGQPHSQQLPQDPGRLRPRGPLRAYEKFESPEHAGGSAGCHAFAAFRGLIGHPGLVGRESMIAPPTCALGLADLAPGTSFRRDSCFRGPRRLCRSYLSRKVANPWHPALPRNPHRDSEWFTDSEVFSFGPVCAPRPGSALPVGFSDSAPENPAPASPIPVTVRRLTPFRNSNLIKH